MIGWIMLGVSFGLLALGVPTWFVFLVVVPFTWWLESLGDR